MRIKKTSETTPIQAQVVNQQSNSTTDSYSCDYINNNVGKEVYSTNEQVIGTWIDGKPLYRKMIQVNGLPNASSMNITFKVDNIDMIHVNKSQSVIRFPTGNTQAFDYIIPTDNVSYITCNLGGFNETTNYPFFTIFTGSNRSSCTAYMCIEYTKTTD